LSAFGPKVDGRKSDAFPLSTGDEIVNGAALTPRGDIASKTSPKATESRLIIFITVPPEVDIIYPGSLLFSFRCFSRS
jgi:hypothetical protein